MTDRNSPREWWWPAIAAALAVIVIAVLWPLRTVGQVCILIYPPPPGCGSPVPQFAVLGAIALIIVLLGAIAVVWFTASGPRVPMILLTAGILAVGVIALALVQLSQAGAFDPPYPMPVE